MALRRSVDQTLSNPLLIWGQRFVVVILILVAALTLAADRLFPAQVAMARTAAADVLSPMVDAAGAPVRWSQRQIISFQAYLETASRAQDAEALAAEVAGLRLELSRVRDQMAEFLIEMQAPSDALEAVLTARLMVQGNSLTNQSLLLNVGRRDGRLVFDRAFAAQFQQFDPSTGLPIPFRNPCLDAEFDRPPEYCLPVPVRSGLAVVNGQGIIGRLSEVGHNAARVRLLTSADSRLPVLVGEFRIKGTVFGNDTNILTLSAQEAADGSIQIGDQVRTSSIDPDIPFLFHVGEVVALSPEIQVQPAAISSAGLDTFVQVVLKEPLMLASQGDGLGDFEIPIEITTETAQ